MSDLLNAPELSPYSSRRSRSSSSNISTDANFKQPHLPSLDKSDSSLPIKRRRPWHENSREEPLKSLQVSEEYLAKAKKFFNAIFLDNLENQFNLLNLEMEKELRNLEEITPKIDKIERGIRNLLDLKSNDTREISESLSSWKVGIIKLINIFNEIRSRQDQENTNNSPNSQTNYINAVFIILKNIFTDYQEKFNNRIIELTEQHNLCKEKIKDIGIIEYTKNTTITKEFEIIEITETIEDSEAIENNEAIEKYIFFLEKSDLIILSSIDPEVYVKITSSTNKSFSKNQVISLINNRSTWMNILNKEKNKTQRNEEYIKTIENYVDWLRKVFLHTTQGQPLLQRVA